MALRRWHAVVSDADDDRIGQWGEMIESHTTAAFLAKTTGLAVLDVRSPSEFAAGHIPGAHSLALFEDDERAEVGRLA